MGAEQHGLLLAEDKDEVADVDELAFFKKNPKTIASIQKSRTFAASLVKSIIGLLNALTH